MRSAKGMEEQKGRGFLLASQGSRAARESLGGTRSKLHGASSVPGFMYGSHVPLYPDFGAKHNWGNYQWGQLVRAPGQGGCLAEAAATTSQSRWMGSAAEGAPKLERGIAKTSAVLHLSCTSWCQMGHTRRVVLNWGSTWASGESWACRSLCWKRERWKFSFCLSWNNVSKGNCLGWMADLSGSVIRNVAVCCFPLFPKERI